MAALERTGISIDDVARELLDEGVRTFSTAFDSLMASIEAKREGALARGFVTSGSGTSQAHMRR
jgi:hypothetical protein